MKKLVLFLAIVGIALSSCNGKYTIAKRKYNKGFYVSRSTGNKGKKQDVAQQNCVKPADLLNTEAVLNNNNSDVTIIESESINHPVKSFVSQILPKSTKPNNNNQSEQILASTNSNSVAKHVYFKKLDITGSETKTTNNKGGDDDVKLILCVILAIFIPPLGMYLWDQKTDIWFIVDLILFLLLFSWFFWGALGLVGLAAIVIALLRVFDKI